MFHNCQLWHPPKDWENFFFTWKFWSRNIFMLFTHVTKFKSKRPTKKMIFQIYQPGVVVRNKGENRSNFDSLPTRAENLLFPHEIFVTWSLWCWSHVWEFSRPKDTHKNSYSSILGKRFSPLFLTTTLVGRFGMSLSFCRSFGLECFLHV
jgi:hypothetical protein